MVCECHGAHTYALSQVSFQCLGDPRECSPRRKRRQYGQRDAGRNSQRTELSSGKQDPASVLIFTCAQHKEASWTFSLSPLLTFAHRASLWLACLGAGGQWHTEMYSSSKLTEQPQAETFPVKLLLCLYMDLKLILNLFGEGWRWCIQLEMLRSYAFTDIFICFFLLIFY